MRKALIFMALAATGFSLVVAVGIVQMDLGGDFWDPDLQDARSLANLEYGRFVSLFFTIELLTLTLLFGAMAGLTIAVYLTGLIVVYVGMPGLSAIRAFLLRYFRP